MTTITCIYNADGQRVKQSVTVSGVTTTMVYVGNYYEVTNSITATKYYYFGAQRVAMRTSAGVTYLHGDHLGSTSATSGAQNSKQWYYAFGGVRATEGTLPTDFTFTGQRADSDGLMYYNARYYDATLNRFIQPDSIIPNLYNPQSLNRYSYVRNNPMRYTDPTGHRVCEDDDSDCNNGHGTPGTWTPPAANADLDNTPAETKSEHKENSPAWMLDLNLYCTYVCPEQFFPQMDAWFDAHPGYYPLFDPRGAEVETYYRWWFIGQLANGRQTETAFINGTGVVLLAGIASPLKSGPNNTFVYLGVRDGEPVYVGITNDIQRRQGEHGDRFVIEPINNKPITRGQGRAIEQYLIEQNPQFENVRNSISPLRSWYQSALKFAQQYLNEK